jgi:hypothetical protein
MIRRIGVLASVAALAAVFGSTAKAAPVTVGSPLTASPIGHFGGSATEANVALSEPEAQEVSPVDGVIVRYRVDVESLGQFAIRVLRPAAGGTYTGAGTGTPVTPSVQGIQTFSSSLPIRAGDLIGLDLDDNAGVGQASVSGSTIDEWGNPGFLADGVTAPPNTVYQNEELLFNGDVEPDADHDGFGDESQDQCPTDATTQGTCPPPTLPAAAGLTGQRAAALNKCKSKSKKKHWSKRRLKKCKKKAKKLPV